MPVASGVGASLDEIINEHFNGVVNPLMGSPRLEEAPLFGSNKDPPVGHGGEVHADLCGVKTSDPGGVMISPLANQETFGFSSVDQGHVSHDSRLDVSRDVSRDVSQDVSQDVSRDVRQDVRQPGECIPCGGFKLESSNPQCLSRLITPDTEGVETTPQERECMLASQEGRDTRQDSAALGVEKAEAVEPRGGKAVPCVGEMTESVHELARILRWSTGRLVSSLDQLKEEMKSLTQELRETRRSVEPSMGSYPFGVPPRSDSSAALTKERCGKEMAVSPHGDVFPRGFHAVSEDLDVARDQDMGARDRMRLTREEPCAVQNQAPGILKNPFSVGQALYSSLLPDPVQQRRDEMQRAAQEKQQLVDERRRRVQLEHRARQLMDTISQDRDRVTSLFNDDKGPNKPRGETREIIHLANPLFQ